MTIAIRFGVHATLHLPADDTFVVCPACGGPVAPREWYREAASQAVTILGGSAGAHCYSCLAPVEDERLAVVMHGEDGRTANVFVVKREWLEAK